MSDAKKPANVSAEQDLQDLTNAAAKQRNAFTDEEGNNNSTVRADEADQSLSAIHTGDRTNYEDSFESQRAGSESLSSEEQQASESSQETVDNANETVFENQSIALDGGADSTSPEGADLRPEAQSFDNQGNSEGSLLGATQTQFGSREPSDQPLGFYENEEISGSDNRVRNEDEVDAAPHSLSLDDGFIPEDAAVGDVVGIVSAEDPEGGKLSYSLADDAGGMFTSDA